MTIPRTRRYPMRPMSPVPSPGAIAAALAQRYGKVVTKAYLDSLRVDRPLNRISSSGTFTSRLLGEATITLTPLTIEWIEEA